MSATVAAVAAAVAHGRARRAWRRRAVTGLLAVLVLGAFTVSLMVGQTFYTPTEVWHVVLGETVPGASFTVGELRLPRAVLAVVAGASFGLAGTTFQTMLRNPLAAPDVIGISSGASVAAVYGIVVLSLSDAAVSLVAVTAALVTALLIYLLAFRDGVVGTRLILIGIAVAAMLESVVSFLLMRAAAWDVQTAMRWLTGSLNGATWGTVTPLMLAFVVAAPALLARSRHLDLMQLGDDAARALGVRTEQTRLVVIVAAVALVAFATAAAGPIAFVAFLSGPIAARVVGPGGSLMIPAAMVGALIVLVADLAGQYAFGTRYPVGVITGVLGAPYLIYLLVRTNHSGASL